MAFNWSLPNPLLVTSDATILGVYIKELQDAVNTLRVYLGKSQIAWSLGTIPEVINGNTVRYTLFYAHIDNLRVAINNLITDFAYTSVVDILGRSWSDYQVLMPFGKSAFRYEIVQDFRDVLDSLMVKMEEWKISTNIQGTRPIRNLYGDLGLYSLIDWDGLGRVNTDIDSLTPGYSLDLRLIGDTLAGKTKVLVLEYADIGKRDGKPQLHNTINVGVDDKLYFKVNSYSSVAVPNPFNAPECKIYFYLGGNLSYPNYSISASFSYIHNFSTYDIITTTVSGGNFPHTNFDRIVSGSGLFSMDIYDLIKGLATPYHGCTQIRYIQCTLQTYSDYPGSVNIGIGAFGLAKNYTS